MEKERSFYQRLKEKGVSRRDFMKYCTALTATMGLSASFVPKVAEVFAAPAQRPPVIWLHFGECTGCSEALLRSQYPYVDDLVLEVLSVEYHETIMAAAGHQAEEQLHNRRSKNTRASSSASSKAPSPPSTTAATAKSAAAPSWKSPRTSAPRRPPSICIGTCSVLRRDPRPHAQPRRLQGRRRGPRHQNPQHPRMPAQPDQFRGHRGQLSPPRQTARPGRPGAAAVCLRQDHPRSVPATRPLRKRGVRRGVRLARKRPWAIASTRWAAKGPETYNNCPIAKFNDGTSWPVEAGHPCIGCSEPDFWDKMTPFYRTSSKRQDTISERRGGHRMAKRVTIDPITRIEGHLRIEVEVEGGKVTNAWSSAPDVPGHRTDPAGARPARRAAVRPAILRGLNLHPLLCPR